MAQAKPTSQTDPNPAGQDKSSLLNGRPVKSSTDAAAQEPSKSSLTNTDSVDLRRWPGWVDLLSEPTHFNTLLKDFGVRGIKIHEVIGLDRDDLINLPRPVFALIFLFKWKQSERDEDIEDEASEHIWFAQQVAENACASNALLNIVNNIPDLELGNELQTFKDRTQELTPLEKGHEVKAFHFIRAIHNSFATAAEIRDTDMLLQRSIASARRAEVADARKTTAVKKAPVMPSAVNAAATRSSGRLRNKASSPASSTASNQSGIKRKSTDDDGLLDTPSKRPKHVKEATSKAAVAKKARKKPAADLDAANHFCAYMPINGQLWKLDGLEPTPELICDYDLNQPEDWLDKAANTAKQFMDSYSSDVYEFNMMAVVRDPLLVSKDSLSENIKSIQVIEKKLTAVVEDWAEAQSDQERAVRVINGIDAEHNITQVDIEDADSPKSLDKKLEDVNDLAILLDMRKAITDRQPNACADVRTELARSKDDDIQSHYYRHNYDAFFDHWFDQLAQEEALDDMMADAAPA